MLPTNGPQPIQSRPMAPMRLAVSLALMTASAVVINGKQDRVEQVLLRARNTLAGQPPRALPTTVTITGTKSILSQAANTKLAFEIYAQLPDKFVWKEDAGVLGKTVRGFDRGRLITNQPESLSGRVPQESASSPNQRASVQRDDEQLQVIRWHFASLAMGMFASPFKSVPLKFGEVNGGAANNAIGISGPDGFAATMVFDRPTGLPQWLAYRVETANTGQSIHRLEYADFRPVEGRTVPFKWVWLSGSGDKLTPNSEYLVGKMTFDLPIDPKVFK